MAASMVDVMKYFDLKPGEFRKEWAALSDSDKEDLKRGIGDGTLTY